MDHKTSQVKAFFNQTHRYLNKPFGVRLRARIARRMLGEVSQKRFLDIGCGDGSISLQFLEAGNEITLLDVSENMLTLAQQNIPSQYRRYVTVCHEDFMRQPTTHPYDVVLCMGVLAHVSDVSSAIEKLSLLVGEKGTCLVQISDQTSGITRIHLTVQKWRRHRSDSYHYSLNTLSYTEMVMLFRKNGFLIVDEVRYSLLLPGMGLLPESFLYRYQLFILNHPHIARYGSDVIFKLERLGAKVD